MPMVRLKARTRICENAEGGRCKDLRCDLMGCKLAKDEKSEPDREELFKREWRMAMECAMGAPETGQVVLPSWVVLELRRRLMTPNATLGGERSESERAPG